MPPFGQPARMQGSISAGGKVAKWASLNGCVVTSHTLRLLRPDAARWQTWTLDAGLHRTAHVAMNTRLWPPRSSRLSCADCQQTGSRNRLRIVMIPLALAQQEQVLVRLGAAVGARSRGIGLGFDQMMSWRRYQPSACRAKATRHGMPIRSLRLRSSACASRCATCAFREGESFLRVLRTVAYRCCRRDTNVPRPFLSRLAAKVSAGIARAAALGSRSHPPAFSHAVPSLRSTRCSSRNTATICSGETASASGLKPDLRRRTP